MARQCHITAVSWLVCPNSHMLLETNTIQTLQTNTMQTQHKYKKQTKCHKTVARWQVCSNGHMLPNCAPRAIFGHKATFVNTTLIIYFAIQTNTFCYFGQMHIIFWQAGPLQKQHITWICPQSIFGYLACDCAYPTLRPSSRNLTAKQYWLPLHHISILPDGIICPMICTQCKWFAQFALEWMGATSGCIWQCDIKCDKL